MMIKCPFETHNFGPLQRRQFCRHCFKANKDYVFVDRIYKDTYASLGLAVMFRSPVAFLPLEDRPEYDMTKYLPPPLPLNQILNELKD